jgi:hypothetical protein
MPTLLQQVYRRKKGYWLRFQPPPEFNIAQRSGGDKQIVARQRFVNCPHCENVKRAPAVIWNAPGVTCLDPDLTPAQRPPAVLMVPTRTSSTFPLWALR